MKRSLRSLLFLILSLCALTMTAFADMGPKDQLTIKVVNPPQEPYVLDLLAEGEPVASSTLSLEEFQAELEELGLSDSTLYYALISEVPSGWHACLCQHSGPPIWGTLTGRQSGDTMLHTFGYVGIPDTYRILIVTKSGETWTSDTYTRTVLQSSVTVDWETKEVSIPSTWQGYVLQFLATFVPTLLMEGLILFLFRYRQKRSWTVFGGVNLVTQGGLAVALSINAIQHGVGFGFFSLFLMAEIGVVIVESAAYMVLLKEHSKNRATAYGIAANAASALIGWFISRPVWEFVVSIS